VKLLKTKSINKVYLTLNEIRKRAKRANNGISEFGYTFQELLIINSIQFKPSLIYKHSLNRVIKQVIRIIVVIIRLIIYKAKLLY
jgi:hypothetical protein